MISTEKMIFVFGSNTAGIHGAGAAKFARDHRGAKWGVGLGLRGQSFAVPTKDDKLITLPLGIIQKYVDYFIYCAKQRDDLQFQVTRLGCGLAGLKDMDIAPMFKNAPENCFFDEAWGVHLGSFPASRFWGTF